MQFDDIVPITGYLTDKYIRTSLENGFLIEKGTYDDAQIRHASYMLRLGETIHIARTSQQSQDRGVLFDIVHINPEKPVLFLHPNETALLFSLEYLRFPPSVLGFTVARGLLFTHPLVPENTYVDPGFTGSLYTVVTNISDRIVELKYGMQIARLFFYKLEEPVSFPYKTGASVGVKQTLVTYPMYQQSFQDQIKQQSFKDLLGAAKKIPITGNFIIEELFERFSRRFEVLFFVIVLWPPVLMVINSNTWLKENYNSITVNLIASILTSGVTWLFLKLWDKFKAK